MPLQYSDSWIHAITTIGHCLGMNLRGCEGMTATSFGDGMDCPDFTTLCRRINSQSTSIKKWLSESESDDIVIELIPDELNWYHQLGANMCVCVVHKLRRGFLRLTIIINKKTLEIVAYKLTDDKIREATVFEEILEDTLVNLGVESNERCRMVSEQKNSLHKTYQRIGITADGAYDSKEIFSVCKNLDIDTKIRVRTNSTCSSGEDNKTRNESVLDQLGGDNATPAKLAKMDNKKREANRGKWKKRVKFSLRWLVEIVISAFKRIYGDSVRSKKMQNIRQEIKQIYTHNMMLRMGWDVIASM